MYSELIPDKAELRWNAAYNRLKYLQNYDFEWHVLGFLCKILIKLGQATHMCQNYAIYSFVTTQALFGTFICQ